MLGEVSWSKVSSENDSLLLAGSEWKVTQTSEFKYGNDGVNGTFEKLATSKEYFVTDCMDACSSEGFADEDSSAGKFKLTGLPWGEYTLEENKAPDGYNLGGVVYKFIIGPSSYNGSAWSVALTVDGATGPADNKIENQPGGGVAGDGRRRKYEDFGYGIACGHGIRCDGRTGPESQEASAMNTSRRGGDGP